MKTIPPRLAGAERENERLKLELEQTKARLAAANAKIIELEAGSTAGLSTKAALSRSNSSYNHATRSSNPSSTLPSYLRPTVASSSRSHSNAHPPPSPALAINPATIAGVKYRYIDGCITEQKKASNEAGYLKHTLTSSEKTVDQHMAQEHGVIYTTKMKQINPKPYVNAESSWAYCEVDDDRFFQENEIDQPEDNGNMLDDHHPDQIEALNQRTRLQDDSFYSTPAGQMHIRFNKQMKYQNMAYVHAQDALWHCLHQKWPQAQKAYYRHGPRSVKFGRDELKSTIASRTLHRLGASVYHAAMHMVSLRNATAHPCERSSGRIDELMKDAQSLACCVGDEQRAMKIRCLRDGLQEQTSRAYKAIVAYEPLCNLPQPRLEPFHHQEVFNEVAWKLNYDGSNRAEVIARYGPEVVRVVDHWKLRRIKPGHDDPEYIANLAKYNDAKLLAIERAEAWAKLRTASCEPTARNQVRDSSAD